MSDVNSTAAKGGPKRLSRQEARKALPEELRGTFDRLCEETLAWSKYYYATNFISYSIIKELVHRKLIGIGPHWRGT